MNKSKLAVERTFGEFGRIELAYDEENKTFHNIDDLNKIRILSEQTAKIEPQGKQGAELKTLESELSEVEKLLGFCVKNGMVWIGGEYQDWSVPRIRDMQRAVEVIQELNDKLRVKQ